MSSTSARSLAGAIRSGERSAESVVRAHIDRARRVNAELNALVLVDEAGAMAAAREADERRARGEELGPLHGVPFTADDAIDAGGLPATAGTVGCRGRVAERDAPAVARLRAAGAILLAKTNVAELAQGFETDNLLFGRTANPWDVTRTPGGASGGEAALIAAGGSPLGLGADAEGSVRVPAHYCGVAALKPTSARVPITGHFPPARANASARLRLCPLARSVEDLALALGVLSREDWRDTASTAMPLAPVEAVKLAGMRVAFFRDNGIMAPTSATVIAVERAADALAAAGAVVEDARPSGIEATAEILPGLYYGSDGGLALRSWLEEIGSTSIHPLTVRWFERAAAHLRDAAAFDALLADWKSFRHAMLRFMDAHDLVVCPVASGPAVPHGGTLREDPMLLFSYAMTFSLTGWPVVTVRAGTSPEGLPIGVQLASRPWREEVALAAALAVERALGDWPEPI